MSKVDPFKEVMSEREAEGQEIMRNIKAELGLDTPAIPNGWLPIGECHDCSSSTGVLNCDYCYNDYCSGCQTAHKDAEGIARAERSDDPYPNRAFPTADNN